MSVGVTETPPPHESGLSSGGWENERDTERAKVSVRWFATLLLFGVLEWTRTHQPPQERISNTVAYGSLAAAYAMTALETLYLWTPPSRATIPRWFKYLTVFGDMAFTSALIYYTGFTHSPFFFVYFVFLISNCLRYGLLMSLYVAGLFNVLYVIVLGLAPEEARSPSVLGGEGLKIIAFWATAFYGGAISQRMRRQATQLRVYEETIAELRAQLKAEGEKG